MVFVQMRLVSHRSALFSAAILKENTREVSTSKRYFGHLSPVSFIFRWLFGVTRMASYIQVAEDESEEPMEIPCESDGTLLLSTLVAQFPGACGLKFRNPETGAMRGIRLVDGQLHPPEKPGAQPSWGSIPYIAVFPKGTRVCFESNCFHHKLKCGGRF